MASSKEFLEYILEQLSELEEIAYRVMMGGVHYLPQRQNCLLEYMMTDCL